uniref:Uncharacterized protein n=1 Tax=Avena sativa TaxID=4498 RepID=A0ACD5W5D0_AVESA
MGKQLFFLAILLIVSLETATTMVRGDLACDTPKPQCLFKCYKGAGKCMRCCQGNSYVQGQCNFFHFDLCYCCNNTLNLPGTAAGRHGWQPQTGVPTPIPHFLHA